MKVEQFAARNYKRLRYVELKPEGELVVIGGRNAQGKTSALDALADALSGSKTKALEPVRKGEARADIVVRTDTGLTIRKYYTANGGHGLRVQTDDGAEFPNAVTYLAQFFNSLSFDPLDFSRADEKRQAATLRKLAGIDTTELDADREEAFTTRTVVNRRLRDLEGELKNLGPRPVVDGKVVDVDALVTKEEEQERQKDRNHELRQRLQGILDQLRLARANLAELIEDRRRIEERIAAGQRIVQEMEDQLAPLEKQVAGLVEPDLLAIRSLITKAYEQNDAASAAKHWDKVNERVDATKQETQELTQKIEEIDRAKLQQLREAKYPLPELEVDAAGRVLYGGIPFSQASAAEQVKVSAACGLALKPELRLLIIRDGSLLDDESMASLEALAIEFNAQIFIERVGTDGATVVIEDGEVQTP